MMREADTVPLLCVVPRTPMKAPTLRTEALVPLVLVPLAESEVKVVLAVESTVVTVVARAQRDGVAAERSDPASTVGRSPGGSR